ncbi:MAG: chorismate mutase [Eubacteriales bacterium]|nr:chorismate mutase [Eubacteriales bacterium]
MNLSEIRVNIDRVDKEIRELFLERMGLSEQVVTVKAQNADKIFKPDREREIIKNNSEGLPEEYVREYQAMIKRIMEVSRKYQYGRMLALADCFPFEFVTEPIEHKNLILQKKEEDLKIYYPNQEIGLAECLEEAVEAVVKDKVDAGITIMEGESCQVNEELHEMLAKYPIYVNDCVTTNEQPSRKCITFSKHLLVLPEHNRFKIAFTLPNRGGTIAGILSMISDYHVNISELHTAPIRKDNEKDYRFFLELEANMNTELMRSLIFQLSEETQMFQILGSYRYEGDF